jgi:uncharacterized protein YcgI (DUF1989 family)
MAVFNRVESPRIARDAIYSEVIQAGDGWMRVLEPGQVLRIVDMEGNQAADTLFYDAENPEDHYSALKIVADTCGRHDTVGGSCSAQSNTVRYSHNKLSMHNCRDTFMLRLAQHESGAYTKRDLAPNINFFMNVPVTPDGGLKFDDGVSAPGCYVEVQSIGCSMVLISNCPQLNNPCNAYNPTPVQVLIWEK